MFHCNGFKIVMFGRGVEQHRDTDGSQTTQPGLDGRDQGCTEPTLDEAGVGAAEQALDETGKSGLDGSDQGSKEQTLDDGSEM